MGMEITSLSPWNHQFFALLLCSSSLSPPLTPRLSAQGAVVGLIAGLAMAFWIGIGNFVIRMSALTPVPTLNTTALPLFDNMTTIVTTSLVSATTAKPR